jgi:hypothetical protein
MCASFWLRACLGSLAGLVGLSRLAQKDAAGKWFFVLGAGLALMSCACLATGRVALRVDDAGACLAGLAFVGLLWPVAAGRRRVRRG